MRRSNQRESDRRKQTFGRDFLMLFWCCDVFSEAPRCFFDAVPDGIIGTDGMVLKNIGVKCVKCRRIRLSSRHRKAEVLISALLRSSVSRGSDSHLGCHSLPLPLRILRSYAQSNKKVHCLRQWTFLFGRGRRIRTRDPRFWRPVLYQLSYTPVHDLSIISHLFIFCNTFFKIF